MKRIVSVILVITLLVSLSFSITASSLTEGLYEYSIKPDGTATITSYTGTEVIVNIPETLGGYTVTEIGHGAFENNTYIQKVTLSDSIEILCVIAFDHCTNLKEFTCSKNLKEIRMSAFGNCTSLTKINFNNKLQSVHEVAFNNCTSLTYLNFPGSVTSIRGIQFSNCPNLTYIRIPHGITSLTDSFCYGIDPSKVTIVGCAGSYIETFAADHGLLFAATECVNHSYVNNRCPCCKKVLGDVDSDHFLTPNDPNTLEKYLNGESVYMYDWSVADYNLDGFIDMEDVSAMRQAINH